jgi:N-acyl-D-aspartate/D-glutamate deacylase
MNRRRFVAAALAAAVPLPARRGIGRIMVSDRNLALVLRNGRYYRGGQWQVGDVGIDAAGKLAFGAGLEATQTIDVTDRVIAPGFIDVLADNSANPAATYPIFEKYKVADGVATALQMHGGSADCEAYYAEFGARPHLINYGVSTAVMTVRARAASLRERRRMVERNLANGALGVSHSLEYQPTSYDETLEYAKLAARYDRPFFLHLRYSSAERELEGVAEAVRLARDSGVRLHIDHLHSTGGTFHMEEALSMIRAAIDSGCAITVCVYPYTFWATYLYSRRFGSGWQQRYGLGHHDLRVVGSGERLTVESFARYRQTGVLVAVPEGTMPCERTIDLAVREDFCLIASDGGIQAEPRANSHPRGAGCFATAIRYGLDHGIELERILAKMTSLPREVVRPALAGRGVLEDGAMADLTVFDPATIRGNATLENPNQLSSGIDLVIVNGQLAYRDRQPALNNGAAIRY